MGWQNELVFWLCGQDGHVRNGQGIRYDGLNRIKSSHARFLYKARDGFRADLLYGAEQLRAEAHSWTGQRHDKQTVVVLVESPKTALLSSVLFPDRIWLASMGTSGVTPTKARDLKGRTVRILFDNDQAGHDGAVRALRVLLHVGAFASILHPEVVFGGPRIEGWDMGDEVTHRLGGIHAAH